MFFLSVCGYEEAAAGEAAFNWLQGGDWLIGSDGAGTSEVEVIAFVPAPITPSCPLMLYDATDGGRPNLVESICNYAFENGAHKLVARVLSDKPQYLTKYGFREVGALHSEALSNDTWMDILLYEKLHPDWTEEVGEALPEVAPQEGKKRGRSLQPST